MSSAVGIRVFHVFIRIHHYFVTPGNLFDELE